MALDIARGSLYRGAINLWVEDKFTRAYLSAIWNDPAIAIFIGGGHAGVRAIVHDAETAEFKNVFALVDRDFRKTNRDDWSNPTKTIRTYVLPAHEIENYLLHAVPLRACRYHNRNLSVDQIEAHLLQAAQRLTWWTACRAALAELKSRFHEGFTPDPGQNVNHERAACDYIRQSQWFRELEAKTSRSIADVDSLVKVAHSSALERLEDGSWREDFAGKEILRDVLSRLCDQPRIPNFPSSHEEFHADVAKEIAAWQAVNHAIPDDLHALHEALRARVGMSPRD
jgi:hypothetical protein